MNTIGSIEAHASKERISSSLWKELETVSQKCINCKLCQKECEFLRRYGKPKEIADSYNPGDKNHQAMPFECSLCRLCAAVCPVKINPALMFIEMRRQTVRSGNGD
jgi:heterodisulfide reductase subunit C